MLKEDDDTLPALFRSADRASLEGQQSAREYVRWALMFGLVAAVAGLFEVRISGSIDLAAGIGALAFAASLILTMGMSSRQLESRWYEGRAVAESVKTLAWRFAVGGQPFPLSNTGTELNLADQIVDLVARVRIKLTVASGDQITDEMRRIRQLPLAERKAVYLKGRLNSQAEWYATKAALNEERARLWTAIAVGANAFGAMGGLARAIGLIHFDLLGLAAAAAGSATAWLQLKQHRTLSTSYALANQELLLIRERLRRDFPEDEWSTEVKQAEEAISREHTMWLARQGTSAL
jgi:SMODS and SLOG-associating 2TM effector domain 3/SMODS and SLOG-associating 2TM effector domain 1